MGFSFKSTGSFDLTRKALGRLQSGDIFSGLSSYGQRGVQALSAATPKESGKTASSWSYRLIRRAGRPGIEWYNSHENQGESVVVLIEYGHGTGTGGYVKGRPFINNAIQPIMDEIADDVWKKVIT